PSSKSVSFLYCIAIESVAFPRRRSKCSHSTSLSCGQSPMCVWKYADIQLVEEGAKLQSYRWPKATDSTFTRRGHWELSSRLLISRLCSSSVVGWVSPRTFVARQTRVCNPCAASFQSKDHNAHAESAPCRWIAAGRHGPLSIRTSTVL